MLLALLLTSVTAAADFDYRAPQFWRKPYSIPLSYCIHAYTVESSTLPSTGLRGCRTESFSYSTNHVGTRARLLCPAPGDKAFRVRSKLGESGRVLDYQLHCQPVPEHPELYYKRDHLKAEIAALKVSSAAAPAISGLVEAQLGTLAAFIEVYELARTPLVEIFVIPPGDSREEARRELASRRSQDEWAVRKAQMRHMREWHPWDRRSYAACEQVPYALLEFSIDDDASGLAALERALSKIGTPVFDASCAMAPDLRAGRMLLHPGDSRSLQRAAAYLPGLTAWSSSNGRAFAGYVSDDDRVELLAKDLKEHAAALEAAPHVRALAEGEIDRVRETSDKVRSLKKGLLVFVRLVPRDR